MLFSYRNRPLSQFRKLTGALVAVTSFVTFLPRADAQMVNPASVSLKPYQDPWARAQPRYWDIADRQFNGFVNDQSFAYNGGQVNLTYDVSPKTRQFSGAISATGLKPNFCYQIKLVGKPVSGLRGWGQYGDDWANERIGYAGRWWCDETQSNVTDAYYEANYKNVTDPTKRKTVYGYLYVDMFVTDKEGNAAKSFVSTNSYHVTWQHWQKSSFSTFYYKKAGTYSPYSDSGYGYGTTMPSSNPVTLYFEYEPGRSQSIQLTPGNYNCRLLLTEESFHNQYGGTDDPLGGFWNSVLSNEDFVAGAPDADSTNDIAFTIVGPPVAPTGLTVTAVSTSQVGLKWTDNDPATNGFKIERSTNNKTYTLIQTFGDDTATTFTNTGLAANTTYYYRVRSFNGAGDSAYSNVVSVKTPRR